MSVWALPPGADVAEEIARGLLARVEGPAEALVEVTVLVNTRRLQRRTQEAFAARAPILPPRVRLIGDLAADIPVPGLAPAAPRLRRRLQLAPLIEKLIETDPTLAARTAVFDLADTLAALMEELHEEGVGPEALADLEVEDQSGHWTRALRFVQLTQRYFGEGSERAPDTGERLRRVIEHQIARWEERAAAGDPERRWIVLAGSTGSRGATLELMAAVAGLENGHVILPGLDRDMRPADWKALEGEAHPQALLARAALRMGARPWEVAPWTTDESPCPPRARLLSLALRPAPVTDAWMRDGPQLSDLGAATEGMTLVEAPNARVEAQAIALRLRLAAEEGTEAALITPDRTLARRVTAALGRWGIAPDDSAGVPLHLSAPGRLLRQLARLRAGAITIEGLLAMLKHPLVRPWDRGGHLERTRALELHLRRKGPAFPAPQDLPDFAKAAQDELGIDCGDWCDWLAGLLRGASGGRSPLSVQVAALRALAQEAAGDALWEREAGEEALAAMEELAREAPHGGDMGARDFEVMLERIFSVREVRQAVVAHPRIRILGTLEARGGVPDLAILGGLNDTVWPPLPAPDPWMNRAMRERAGLPTPERETALSAHDFLQAASGGEVWLTRSIRDDDAETVQSRWLGRIRTLLGGLPETGGTEALAGMAARGARWIAWAEAIDVPAGDPSPERRPAPAPPLAARPRSLSVSSVRDLRRDPYAVYARQVLRLYPLDPLRPAPDAPLRGTLFHDVLDRLVAEGPEGETPAAMTERLIRLGEQALERTPWPVARRLWRGRLMRVAPWFAATEAERRARGTTVGREVNGRLELPDIGFTLRARADRIDRTPGGGLILYDYKTGTPPSEKAQKVFDVQLLLEALIAEAAGFDGIPPAPVEDAVYIGLGSTPREVPAPLEDRPPERLLEELRALVAHFDRPGNGYVARLAMEQDRYGSDYDHLSRFGEWDATDPAQVQVLT